MFVIVAVEAEQFPVAAIGRVVVMVMVAMVHGELGQVAAVEFAPAATTDPGVHLQGFGAVSGLAFSLLSLGIGDDFLLFVAEWR